MDRLTGMSAFVKVVDSGGFSAAARRLNMSVTMVSNHVQALEDRLGSRLLNRTTRKVSLTEAGKAYYERCVQILADIEAADASAGAAQAVPRGTLRLYAGHHIVRFIAPAMAEFLSAYPEASIEMMTGERMVDLVEEGFDLAIRPVAPPESALIVRRLAGWRHVLVCAPAYLEAHPRPERLEDLPRHNCLRFTYYPYGEEWRFTGPDGKPASVRVAGNLVTSSGEALRAMTLSGLGLFLAPRFLIDEDLRAGTLVPLLPEYRPVEFAMHAIYPHRQHLSAKVRGFLDLVVAHVGAQETWR